MTDCVYLKEATGKETDDGRPVYGCQLHEFCTTGGKPNPYASCKTCKDRLPPESEKLATDFVDPLLITDRRGIKTEALRNMLNGRSAFLVCGGPSAKNLDLSQLERRGVWSLAVNNMAGYFRARAFICADPPSKFHDGIWLDPTIMKFVPTPKMKEKRGRLRRKVGDEFEDLYIDGKQISACHCPNVWGFGRRSWFMPDETFFTDEQAAWGNHNEGVKKTGLEKTVMTMLLGLRILFYLGARTIYLVGVDFWMDPEADLQGNYAFGENRDRGAISSNNSQFAVCADWMQAMQDDGIFEKFGVRFYNCYARSGLRAFPYVPFDVAVQDALKNMPDEPYDLTFWYSK